MTELLITFMAIITAAFAVRTYLKFRQAAGWTVEEETISEKPQSLSPSELRERQREQPSENIFESPDKKKENPKEHRGPINHAAQ
jgi:hypothetical protein